MTNFLKKFREKNVSRCNGGFGKGNQLLEWSETDWACALAGEVGELCNIIKKRKRYGTYLSEGMKVEVANEIADVFTYLDLLAARFGFDLEEIVTAKWNEVSDRINWREKL